MLRLLVFGVMVAGMGSVGCSSDADGSSNGSGKVDRTRPVTFLSMFGASEAAIATDVEALLVRDLRHKEESSEIWAKSVASLVRILRSKPHGTEILDDWADVADKRAEDLPRRTFAYIGERQLFRDLEAYRAESPGDLSPYWAYTRLYGVGQTTQTRFTALYTQTAPDLLGPEKREQIERLVEETGNALFDLETEDANIAAEVEPPLEP